MAVGAILATALTDHSAHPWGLFVAGLDVIKQPGGGYGTPIGTISVDHSGPDAPGSMTFTVEDPASALSFREGDEVRLYDFVNDRPVFYGFVQTVTSRPRPSTPGQDITVTAVDADILLDWLVLGADTVDYSAFGTTKTIIQSLYAQCVGVGVPLNTGSGTAADTPSTRALPVQVFSPGTVGGVGSLVVSRGTSLRAAVHQVMDKSYYNWPTGSGNTYAFAAPQFMVDEYGGLRAWGNSTATNTPLIPTDWVTATITDTIAGTPAEGLEHTLDGGAVIRTVTVTGTDFTLVYNDGTGRPGASGQVSVGWPSAGTQAFTDAYALWYLTQQGVRFRGTIPQFDWTPPVGVHVGGLVDLTDANTAATGTYVIRQISRTFNASGRENWTITYGGIAASVTAFIRRLTRDTLS